MSTVTLGNGKVRENPSYYNDIFITPKGGNFPFYPSSSMNERYARQRAESAWVSKYQAAANHIKWLYEQNPHDVEELAAAALHKVLGEDFQAEFTTSAPENAYHCLIANMVRQHHYDVDVDYYYVNTESDSYNLAEYDEDGAIIAGVAWAFDQGWLDAWNAKTEDD